MTAVSVDRVPVLVDSDPHFPAPRTDGWSWSPVITTPADEAETVPAPVDADSTAARIQLAERLRSRYALIPLLASCGCMDMRRRYVDVEQLLTAMRDPLWAGDLKARLHRVLEGLESLRRCGTHGAVAGGETGYWMTQLCNLLRTSLEDPVG